MISTSNVLSKRWFGIYILLKQLRFCPVYFHCPFVPIFFYHLKPAFKVFEKIGMGYKCHWKKNTKQIVDQSTNRVVDVVYMTRDGRNRSLGWFADQSLAIATGKCRARAWISFGLIQAFYFAKTSKKKTFSFLPGSILRFLFSSSWDAYMVHFYDITSVLHIIYTLCMPFEDNLFLSHTGLFFLTLIDSQLFSSPL